MLRQSSNLPPICPSSSSVITRASDTHLPGSRSSDYYGETINSIPNRSHLVTHNQDDALKRKGSTYLKHTSLGSSDISSSPPATTTAGLSATSTTDFLTRQTSTTSSDTLSGFFPIQLSHTQPLSSTGTSANLCHQPPTTISAISLHNDENVNRDRNFSEVNLVRPEFEQNKSRSGSITENVTHTRSMYESVAPSVKLPLMASFPNAAAEAPPPVLHGDRQETAPGQIRNAVSSVAETEPSSFLRMRVHNFQQQRQQKLSNYGPPMAAGTPNDCSPNEDIYSKPSIPRPQGCTSSWSRHQSNSDSVYGLYTGNPQGGLRVAEPSGTAPPVDCSVQQQSYSAFQCVATTSQSYLAQPNGSTSHTDTSLFLGRCSPPLEPSSEPSNPRGAAIRSASMDSASLTSTLADDPAFGRMGTTTSPQFSTCNIRNQPNTRSKLSALQDKIVRFEGRLQVESQNRKAAEENRLNVLREAIGSVEKTLNAEVRRRLDANKTIQSGFESQLSTLQAHVERSLGEKSRQVTEAIEALSTRIRAAEDRVTAMGESQHAVAQKLSANIEQAVTDIRTLKEHLDNELKARRQREAILLDRLTDVEKQLDSRVTLERGIREKDVAHLRSTLDTVHENHVALDETFQQTLANRFHDLKVSLQQESQAREQADDDIVQALNHYTAALQSALSIANST